MPFRAAASGRRSSPVAPRLSTVSSLSLAAPSSASRTPAPGFSGQRECGPARCLVYTPVSVSLVSTGLLHTCVSSYALLFHMAVDLLTVASSLAVMLQMLIHVISASRFWELNSETKLGF